VGGRVIWNDERIVALDFETSGTLEEYALQPWRIPTGDFWATSVSLIRWQQVDGAPKLAPDGSRLFFHNLDGLPLRLEYETISAYLRELLQQIIDNDWTVVTWFGVFDISVCIAYGCEDLVHRVKWLDGMLIWRHLTIEPEYDMDRSKKKSYSLKAAVPEIMPVEHHGYEENIDFHSTDQVSLVKLQHYNDRDSVYTWVAAKVFWDELSERQRNAALIEAECLSMVAEANYRGMLVDTLHARELAAKLEKVAAEMLEKLAPHGVTEKIVRSPAQLGKLMFDDWKLPVLKENTGKKTGKVSRATDQEVLHELAFVDDRCRDLRAYREALGNKTKFADTPLVAAAYNGDGRARPAAIVFGTYSGRMTYSSSQGKGVNLKQTGFALHQEKRGKDFRGIITAPPGYTLMEFDAAGQEFRWMAELSHDETMLQLCQPGEDPHAYMGASIVGREYRELQAAAKTDDEQAFHDRFLGKFANLSVHFRVGSKKLRSTARVKHNLPIELPESQRIISVYKSRYVRVPQYWDIAIRRVRNCSYAETLAGRRVQVVGDWSGKDSWGMESTAIIYPIQGTGADQKYLAFKVIKDYIININAYFAWDLHDGIYLYVPDDKVEQAAVEITRLLNNLPYREAWDFTPSIPLPWDCKYGPGWGGLKEWKGA
jgi:DNA polymerase I-like protein with 3'-5' exonuclease and polymerase domains